jgi:hypothetical protein
MKMLMGGGGTKIISGINGGELWKLKKGMQRHLQQMPGDTLGGGDIL